MQASPPPRPQLSIYEAISGDEEAVLKTVMSITNGVTAVVDKVRERKREKERLTLVLAETLLPHCFIFLW